MKRVCSQGQELRDGSQTDEFAFDLKAFTVPLRLISQDGDTVAKHLKRLPNTKVDASAFFFLFLYIYTTLSMCTHALNPLSSPSGSSPLRQGRAVCLASASWEWSGLLSHTKQLQRLLKLLPCLQPPPPNFQLICSEVVYQRRTTPLENKFHIRAWDKSVILQASMQTAGGRTGGEGLVSQSNPERLDF